LDEKKEDDSTSVNIFSSQHIQKCNVDVAKKLLEHQNDAVTETARFACGFWCEVSRNITADMNIRREMLFQRIKTRMSS
jgi:hypothetical protein